MLKKIGKEVWIDIEQSEVLSACAGLPEEGVEEYKIREAGLLLYKLLGSLSSSAGKPVIAGGFVRDILMKAGVPKDIDIFMPLGSSTELAHRTMLAMGAEFRKEYKGYSEAGTNFDQEVRLVQKYKLGGYDIDIIYLHYQNLYKILSIDAITALELDEEDITGILTRQGIPLWQVVFDHFDYPCNMQGIIIAEGGTLNVVSHPQAWSPVQKAHKHLTEKRRSYLQDKLPMYLFKEKEESVCLRQHLTQALGIPLAE